MQSKTENNGPAPPDEDADLKRIFQCCSPSFTRVDLDAVFKEANHNLVISASAMQTSPHAPARPDHSVFPGSVGLPSRRRFIMLSKVGAFGVCVASLGAALVIGLGGGNTALAQVQDALKTVKSATYTGTVSVGDEPAQTWKVKLLGDNLCRVDQPNGIYQIFDIKGKKIMEVNPAESKAVITENLPVPKDFNILAKLRNLRASAAKGQGGVPNREIGGKTATGFVIDDNGAEYKVWVDSKTNLPLEMEAERTVPMPEGQGGVKDQRVKERWTDFHFNTPLDESLFAFTAPNGFAVETRQAPANGGAVEDEKRRAEEQQKAAEEAAKKQAK